MQGDVCELVYLTKNILCLKVACFVLLDLTESVRRRQLTFVHISFIGKTLYQRDTFPLLPHWSPFGDFGPHGDQNQFFGPHLVPIFFQSPHFLHFRPKNASKVNAATI